MKYKILYIITGLSYGGAEKQLITLLNNPINKYETILISLTDSKMVNQISNKNIKIINLNIKGFFSLIISFFKIHSFLDKNYKYIVHSWLYHADFFSTILYLTLNFRMKKKNVLIWNIRCSNMCYTLFNYQYYLRFILAKLSFLPKFIISNSIAGKNYHIKIGYKSNKFIVIENGIDTKKFTTNSNIKQHFRNRLSISKDKKIFLIVARNSKMKNLKNIIYTFQKFQNVCLLIIGSETKILSNNKNIYGLGRKNNIQKYYAISDCLVVLSSFGEGFSNALSEGLLSNLPAIVSDVGDNKRLINKNCIVTNPNDTQAIFTSIKKMISRLENIDIKEINNSREMIIENFNIKIMLNKYFNLYNDLIIH